MADFPHEVLGFPTISGYAFAPQEAHDRIQPMRGPPVFRFRQRTPPDRFSVTWLFTEAQLEYFRWWMHVDADRMNQWFTMLLRVGDLPAVENELGAELVEREVHFDGPYEIDHAGNFDGYVVSATLDAKYAAPSTPA